MLNFNLLVIAYLGATLLALGYRYVKATIRNKRLRDKLKETQE